MDSGTVKNNGTPRGVGRPRRQITEDEKKPQKRTRHQNEVSGKKWQPGGTANDYFFDCAPQWTVGDCLNRLLTKVRHNPNNWISIQQFIKDSCKANLKAYFIQVRNSMNRGDNVVMAEVAYLSFIQLTQGDKPLLILLPPQNKPRTKAAAVSHEGFAYKDYMVQVTKHGFELMNAKMSFEDTPKKPKKQGETTRKSSSSNRSSGQNIQQPVSSQGHMGYEQNTQSHIMPPQQALDAFSKIIEQEQEMANAVLYNAKTSIESLFYTIHTLQLENDMLRKDSATLRYLIGNLTNDCQTLKHHYLQTKSQSST